MTLVLRIFVPTSKLTKFNKKCRNWQKIWTKIHNRVKQNGSKNAYKQNQCLNFNQKQNSRRRQAIATVRIVLGELIAEFSSCVYLRNCCHDVRALWTFFKLVWFSCFTFHLYVFYFHTNDSCGLVGSCVLYSCWVLRLLWFGACIRDLRILVALASNYELFVRIRSWR